MRSYVEVQGIEAVRLKLERACYHAGEFTAVWSEFARTGVYRIATDTVTPYTVRFVWTYDPQSVQARQVGTELSLIYGDLLGNLRSALDHLVWQLVLANGQVPGTSNNFPAAIDENAWNQALARGALRGVAEPWVNEVRELEPFTSSPPLRHQLYVLNLVNNMSKHRFTVPAILSPVERGAEMAQFGYAHPKMGGRTFHFWQAEDAVQAGEEFLTITVDPPLRDPVVTPQPIPIQISFEDGLDHSDGWTYTNASLIEWVSDAVRRFEPAFR